MSTFRRWLPMPFALLAASCDPVESTPEWVDSDPEGLVEEAASCARHADCASDLCRHATASPDDAGSCVPATRIIYVDRTRCSPEEGGDGSRTAPFCSIQAAVARADGERRFVRVYPAFYPPFTVSGKRIHIAGSDPGDGAVDVTEEDLDGTVIEGGAEVVLDGVVLGRHSRFGILCDGDSSLVIRRSQVASDVGVGLIASGCTVRLDRDRLSGRDGAMHLTDSSYLVSNTVVTGATERSAIRLDGGSGRILLSTITGNGDPAVGQPAVTCNRGALLADSIVFDNVPGPDGSQLAGDCRLSRVVVGAADSLAASGAIRRDPDLDDGGSLPRTPSNLACCIDRARDRALIDSDIAGTLRPQGPAFDIGAAESP